MPVLEEPFDEAAWEQSRADHDAFVAGNIGSTFVVRYHGAAKTVPKTYHVVGRCDLTRSYHDADYILIGEETATNLGMAKCKRCAADSAEERMRKAVLEALMATELIHPDDVDSNPDSDDAADLLRELELRGYKVTR